jgi:acyl carrier protein
MLRVNLQLFGSQKPCSVSVKNKMKICLKRDSLSFNRHQSYRFSSVSPDYPTANGKLKMHTSSANVRDRILALVEAILEQNSIASEVRPDSRLVDVGLTSMDMVNLMLGVEAEFDLTIPQSEITPENFQSVNALEAMIVQQLQPEAAA